MDAKKIMSGVMRLVDIIDNREKIRSDRYWRFSPEGCLAVERQINARTLAGITEVLAEIRRDVGDTRFKTFSDDELTLVALKFASMYCHSGNFDSKELFNLFLDRPESLAVVVETAIMRKSSPLNGYIGVCATDSGYEFNPLPEKLNALFLDENI